MKKQILVILAFISGLGLSAQEHYSTTVRTENYVEISSGHTVVESGDWNDSVNVAVAMPFEFSYFDVDIDSFYIFGNGMGFTNDKSIHISPHFVAVKARGDGASPISYRVVGDAPNRILQVQWQNFTFSQTAELELLEFHNFQVWFYESNGVIEYHNGSSNVSEASLDSFSFKPGLISIDGSKSVFLNGDPNSPGADYANDLSATSGLNGNPMVNTMFVFTPGFPNSVTTNMSSEVNIYPVPMISYLNVTADALIENIKVFNSAGILVQDIQVNGRNAVVDGSSLTNGVYFLHISTAEGIVTKKIVK